MGDRYRREVELGAMRPPRAVHAFMLVLLHKLAGGVYLSAFFLAGLLAFFQGNAGAADSISGYIDLSYFRNDDKTEIGPLSSETKNRGWRQQYGLSLTKSFYQNLQFSANGLFDQFAVKSTVDGEDTDSRVTLTRPYLDLKWGSYPFTADISYYRTQTDTSFSGSQKTTFISENYQGRLGWRPADLPLLDLYLSHVNSYDKARISRNTVTDQITWTSQYTTLRNLSFRLQGGYLDTQDKVLNLETKTLSNDLRTDYARDFLNGRVRWSGSYEIAHSNTDIAASGSKGNELAIPVVPFQGLSSLTNIPTLGALDPNPFLIDGDTVASAGINIGLPPLGGDARPRNIGLDLFAATEVSRLFVWIDRDQLPDVIANFYSWAVYTSSDNLNWTLITQLPAASFIQLANHFEINFPSIIARYIKVVVRPLTPTAAASAPTFPDPDKIFVTEIQAFSTKSAAKGKSSVSATSQRVNTAVHALLIERYQLYYDLSYSLATASTNIASSPPVWTLSNTFGASQQLSRVFTARANISRQDNKDARGDTVNYNWSVSLDAVPISTLTQNLTYGGNVQQFQEGTTTGHSLYLTTAAQLYTDISAFLNLGAFVSSQFTGRDSRGSTVSLGTTLSPSRKLSLTLSYGFNGSRESGGGRPESSSSNSSTDIAVSYNPFPSLYFYGDWAWQQGNLLQNYNINWSPFQGGAMTLNFFYNEILNQLDNSKSTLMRPYLRFDLKKAGYLSISYSIIHDESKGVFIETSLKHSQRILALEYRVNF